MSTVIPHGIRFKSPTLDGALGDLRILKAEVQSVYEDLATRHIARLAAEAIDIARHDGARADSPMMEAWTRFQRYESKATKSPYPSIFDFTFEVSLIPLQGAVYGTSHTCIGEFRTALLNSGVASEYRYWDNSDKEDETSQEEWDERGRVWEEILSLDPLSRPGRAGLLYDLSPHFFVPDATRIAEMIPDAATRANALADHVARRREEAAGADAGKGLMQAAREGRALRDSLMPELEAGLLPIVRNDLV